MGSATTDHITIKIDSEVVARLNAGEAWVIPMQGGVSTATNWTANRGGSTDIAVEVIAFD